MFRSSQKAITESMNDVHAASYPNGRKPMAPTIFNRAPNLWGFVCVVLVLTSVAFGVYVGGYLCLVKGAVQVIDGVKASPTDAAAMAIGAVRVILSGFSFGVSTLCGLTIPFWILRRVEHDTNPNQG